MKAELDLYTGCIAGAAPVDELKAMLEVAGFDNIRIVRKSGSSEISQRLLTQGVEDFAVSASIEADKPGTKA